MRHPLAIGELLHRRDAVRWRRTLAQIDRVIGAELARELEAARDAVHGNDQPGAHVPRRGNHVQAKAAGALDHQAVALAKSTTIQTLDNLSKRAVDRRSD